MILKQKLYEILKDRNISASALARQAGLPKQTISDWLSGRIPRDIRQIKKVAIILNISVDELCFGDPSTFSQNKAEFASLNAVSDLCSGLFEVRIRRLKD